MLMLLAQATASQAATSATQPTTVPVPVAPAFDWSVWSLSPADLLHGALFLVVTLVVGFVVLLATRKLVIRFQLLPAVLVAIAALAFFFAAVGLKPARMFD